MRQWLAALVVLLAPSSPGQAQPATARGWSVESIPWQTAAANGSKYALLEGSRDTPGGAFTYAFFIPAGVWDSPHWHSTTARVFVAKGRLQIGYGDTEDRSKAAAYEAGGYVVVPGGAHHFDGADTDTVIIGVASGPWSTVYLDASKPASAGTTIR